MQTKSNIGGQMVALAIVFFRSELASKLGWVFLSILGSLAGYLSFRTTSSVLTVWLADRGVNGGMNLPISIGLNFSILRVTQNWRTTTMTALRLNRVP